MCFFICFQSKDWLRKASWVKFITTWPFRHPPYTRTTPRSTASDLGSTSMKHSKTEFVYNERRLNMIYNERRLNMIYNERRLTIVYNEHRLTTIYCNKNWCLNLNEFEWLMPALDWKHFLTKKIKTKNVTE